MEKLENKILDISAKLGNEVHLSAIRNTFISMLPIMIFGGLFAVIGSAPATEDATGFMRVWADFVASNSKIFSWISVLGLGFTTLYIVIGITYNLCKSYKIEPLIPLFISCFGIFILNVNPEELVYGRSLADLTYLDGKGIIIGLFVGIVTVDIYRVLKEKNFGKIKLPESVPPSLSETFSSLTIAVLIMLLYLGIFAIFNAMGTTLAAWIGGLISPQVEATDSLVFILIMTFIINGAWFFGIHNAVLQGPLGVISLTMVMGNIQAFQAGKELPYLLPSVIYGGMMASGFMSIVIGYMFKAKSAKFKQLAKLSFIPSVFNITEPIMFGMPIIMNPMFMIPQCFTQIISGFVTWGLAITILPVSLNPTMSLLPWTTPIFIKMPLAGGINYTIIMIICFAITFMMWYPFIKVADRHEYELEQANEESLQNAK